MTQAVLSLRTLHTAGTFLMTQAVLSLRTLHIKGTFLMTLAVLSPRTLHTNGTFLMTLAVLSLRTLHTAGTFLMTQAVLSLALENKLCSVFYQRYLKNNIFFLDLAPSSNPFQTQLSYKCRFDTAGFMKIFPSLYTLLVNTN